MKTTTTDDGDDPSCRIVVNDFADIIDGTNDLLPAFRHLYFHFSSAREASVSCMTEPHSHRSDVLLLFALSVFGRVPWTARTGEGSGKGKHRPLEHVCLRMTTTAAAASHV